MENQPIKLAARIGAYSALIGSLCMFTGAALWGGSGADLDQALATDQLSIYLTSASESSSFLIANLTFWIIGAMLLGLAGTLMSNICTRQPVVAKIAEYIYGLSATLAIASFIAWLSIVVRLAPDGAPAAALIAEAIGWFASRTDWLATSLIIGFGPALISLAGRNDWVPRWLLIWAGLACLAGVLCVIGIFAGNLSTYAFLVVPVGLGWTIAASFVLFKLARK